MKNKVLMFPKLYCKQRVLMFKTSVRDLNKTPIQKTPSPNDLCVMELRVMIKG